MRLLAFFLNDYGYGEFLRGAERRFFEVSTRLKDLGVEIFALEYESSHSEKLGSHGYFPVKIKRRLPDHDVLSSLRVIVLGLVACVRCKCDVIYVSCRFAWGKGLWVGLVAPYMVSCLYGKPLVIVFHHIEQRDLRERNPIMLGAYRKATCMAVSEATANKVRRLFHVREVMVVGNGVDWDLFRNADCNGKKYDAVFLGRIAEDKGIFDLLKAWEKVVGKIPSAHLLLIGGIEKRTKEKFYEIVHDLLLERNVTVAGFVSDKRMVQLLKSSKIFVLPSLREGFGLAVAEAMAAGLPCIISDLPALREAYSPAAIFVQPSNVGNLADAILSLLLNLGKCSELRKQGEKLASRFSWKEVATKEFKVLKSLTAI